MLLIGGDFNGHVSEHSEGVHVGDGYGTINHDRLWIPDFGVATSLLVVANFFFQENISRLITCSSRGNQTDRLHPS